MSCECVCVCVSLYVAPAVLCLQAVADSAHVCVHIHNDILEHGNVPLMFCSTLQGGEDPLDASSLQVTFRKRAL